MADLLGDLLTDRIDVLASVCSSLQGLEDRAIDGPITRSARLRRAIERSRECYAAGGKCTSCGGVVSERNNFVLVDGKIKCISCNRLNGRNKQSVNERKKKSRAKQRVDRNQIWLEISTVFDWVCPYCNEKKEGRKFWVAKSDFVGCRVCNLLRRVKEK